MIRVLLGQRNALLGGALAAVLSRERDLRVVAELARGDDVLAAAVIQRPDVAVLDGSMPGGVTVSELCRSLHRTVPACRPLVMLDRSSGGGLGRSLTLLAPWLGLLDTDAVPAELVAAVRRLAQGGQVLDTGLAAAARAAGDNPLTGRECELLRLLGEGSTPKEIATRLGLRVGTVRNHLSRSVAKTGARTRLEALRTARNAGWI